MRVGLSATFCAFLFASVSYAADLEELCLDGYGVAERTRVRGDFEGCDFQREVPLVDGLTFVCDGYSYHYSYGAEVLILKNVKEGNLKVPIDRQEFSGHLLLPATPKVPKR